MFLGVSVDWNRHHARQAALALLKLAKSTSNAKVAAHLISLAANLKEQAGELPPTFSPDTQPEPLEGRQ
jgi:hypothetical protein